MFRIDLLPAEYGDAIWIEYGRQRRRHRLLIDCGTSAVYPRLRERILALRESDRHFELLDGLKAAAGSQRTFGEVFLQTKRRLLASGDGFVLSLTAYGDVGWRL